MKKENVKYKIHIKQDKVVKKEHRNTIHDVTRLDLDDMFRIKYYDKRDKKQHNIPIRYVDLLAFSGIVDDASRTPIYEGMRCKATASGETYEGFVIFSKGCCCLSIEKKEKKAITYNEGQTVDLCDFNSLEVLGWVWEYAKEV